MAPAKYRLPPMPPPPCLRTVPLPSQGGLGPCGPIYCASCRIPVERTSSHTVIHPVPNFCILSRITRSIYSVTPEKFLITSRFEYRRTKNPNRSKCRVRSASFFFFYLIMLSAVQFNDHLSPFTAEIHNVLSNNDLPFHPYRITPKEIKPEVPFLFCHILPHLAGKGFQVTRDFFLVRQS